ncbi:MAG: hypothetical protein R3F14_21970 [Polyangiaceae bacterium]
MQTDLVRLREAVDQTRDMPLEEGVREVLATTFRFALERPRLFVWMLRYLPELGLLPAVERWERELAREIRRFLEDHRGSWAMDLTLQSLAGVGALRGAMLILARERPELLEDTPRMLTLCSDLILGTLRAQRARTGFSSSSIGEPDSLD